MMILSQAERRYLRRLIKPFRDEIDGIIKYRSIIGGREYLWFRMQSPTSDFSLPDFQEGTMYKGMTAERKYSLKELGL